MAPPRKRRRIGGTEGVPPVVRWTDSAASGASDGPAVAGEELTVPLAEPVAAGPAASAREESAQLSPQLHDTI